MTRPHPRQARLARIPAGPTREVAAPVRLARRVIRVPRSLDETLNMIAERLLDETAQVHSFSAVMRGLVTLGLLAITEAPHLAPLFVGVRIARGRKKTSTP